MPVDLRLFKPEPGPERDLIHLIVRLREGAAPDPLWAAFLGASATVRHTLPGFRSIALRCPVSALAALEARADVQELAPDTRVVCAIDLAVPAAAVPPLWEEGLTGKGVRISILDTGIDRGHPDFEGRLAAQEDFTGHGLRDDVGHGTFVASVAAGSGEASRGRFRGVAPAASLLVGRVLGSRGEGRISDVLAGLGWAMTREAQVINLSLRVDGEAAAAAPLARALREVAAGGILVCTAGDAGEALVIAPESARTVRCAAAAGSLTAARAYGTTIGKPAGEQYVEAAGASANSALVAGVCALLLESAPGAEAEAVRLALAAGAAAAEPGTVSLNALAAMAELREAVRRR